MSYIDIIDNDLVGYLAAIPLYRPRGTIKGGNEFDCGPDTLVLGGGSGEHPAAVVSNLKALALGYLLDSLEVSHFVPAEAEKLADILAQANASVADIPAYRCFHFAQWGADTYADVIQQCSSRVQTPYSRERFSNFENWLGLTFGELIFYSFPEFAPRIPDSVRDKVDEVVRRGLIWMRNIQVLPPGYPVNGGRQTVDGKTMWGSLAFEVRRRDGRPYDAAIENREALAVSDKHESDILKRVFEKLEIEFAGKAQGQSDFDCLKKSFEDRDISFVIRESDEDYSYIVLYSKPTIEMIAARISIDTVAVDCLTSCGLPNFEFENGKLVSYGRI